MENQIFRKKSMDRISSPEQLNDYLRVSNPGVWMVLLAVIILLIGVCIWGVFGYLDTTLNVVGICKDGQITCYVSDSDIDSVKADMSVTVNGKEYAITGISTVPVAVDSVMDTYALHIGKFEIGEWVCEVTADTDLVDGTYEAAITIDRVAPIFFVLN